MLSQLSINQSINQSEFIFRVVTKLQRNAIALEGLPEKRCAH